jgi:hypothetical protein
MAKSLKSTFQVYENLQNWKIFPAVFVAWKALNKDHNAWTLDLWPVL